MKAKKDGKKIITGALVLAMIVGVFIGCGTEKQVKNSQTSERQTTVLRFGYTATNTDGLTGLVGAARNLGYLDEELGKVGATFEEHPFVKAGPAINAALASKELDIGELGDVPAAVAKSQGADTTLIRAIIDDVRTDLVVRTDLEVSSIADLKGRKIAVQVGSYMQRILYQILAEGNLTPDDVEIVNMSEVDAAAALSAGSIDASPVTSIKGSTLVTAGDAKLLYTTKDKDELASVLVDVVRTDFAKEHPEVIRAFFKALNRASKELENDKSLLRELYIKSGVDGKIIDDAVTDISLYNSESTTTEEAKKIYKNVLSLMENYKMIDRKVDFDQWYDGSYSE